MPELPELEVLRENLVASICGKMIKKLQVLRPYVLKNYFTEELQGERVENIERRGKFLIITLTRHKIIIHLMLRGSINYTLPTIKIKKSSAALIMFTDGSMLEMNERGHKKRMSVYVLKKDESLNRVENLGLEPLNNKFTPETLKEILQSDSRQLKSFLCDQRKIAGIGNAYADEILWKARISPFKMTNRMKDQEIDQLYNSIIDILKWATGEVRKRAISEKRHFLNIHNKQGQPCPRCGESIQSVSYADADTFYCPGCQTKGRLLKNRRISKFYR